MSLTPDARLTIALLLIALPTIEFGGYFLLSQLRKATVIRSDLQASYFRAGHAHAGVWVILAIIAQVLLDFVSFDTPIRYIVRAGFFFAPIFISLGFFLGAPTDSTAPKPMIRFVYVGALLLAFSAILTALGLLFAPT